MILKSSEGPFEGYDAVLVSSCHDEPRLADSSSVLKIKQSIFGYFDLANTFLDNESN